MLLLTYHTVRTRSVSYALATMAFMAIPQNTHAQLSYSWPETDANLSSYHTVFECLSAVNRISRSDDTRLIWRDTVATGPADLQVPLPRSVVDAAARCSARAVASDIPLPDAVPWLSLLLMANRDTDAALLAQRWLASTDSAPPVTPATPTVPTKNQFSVRGQKLSALAQLYSDTRPVRWDRLLSLVAEIQQPDMVIPWTVRYDIAWDVFESAAIVSDSGITHQVASWIAALQQRLTTQEFADRSYLDRAKGFVAVSNFLARSAVLDSLRKGPEAYHSIQQLFTTKLSLPSSKLGTPAPRLAGDFWFPYPQAAASQTPSPPLTIPQPGHVTILIAAPKSDDIARDYALAAMLRRLKSRFPALDIVLTPESQGWFSYTLLTELPKEAEVWRRYYQDFHRIPGSVVFVNRTFWHLPAPDLRRINNPSENSETYPGGLWLLDQHGTIVSVIRPDKREERNLGILIEVLMSRE